MESISTSELLELVLISEQFIDSQIEFWLQVTFATIVASFAGAKFLTRTTKAIVSVLYILATVVFVSRWGYEAIDILMYFDALRVRGLDLEAPWVTVVSRACLVLVGTLATLYFVNIRFTKENEDEGKV
jgi:hypothetical protein